MTLKDLVSSIGEPAGGTREKPVVAISGGFDPLHVGHIDLIKSAAIHGDVVVILNSDGWLIRKKGYKVMGVDDRAKILLSLKGVFAVVYADDEDDTACKSLRRIKPDFFANGGDRSQENTPEIKVCLEEGIGLLWNIGGAKVASSQEIIDSIKK